MSLSSDEMWNRTRKALQLLNDSSDEPKGGLNVSTDSAYYSSPDKKWSSNGGHYEKVTLISVNGKTRTEEIYRSNREQVKDQTTTKKMTDSTERESIDQRRSRRGFTRFEAKEPPFEMSSQQRRKLFGPQITRKNKDNEHEDKELEISLNQPKIGRNIPLKTENHFSNIRITKKTFVVKQDIESEDEELEFFLNEKCSLTSGGEMSNIRIIKKASDVEIEPQSKGSSYFRQLLASKSEGEIKTYMSGSKEKGKVSTKPIIRRVIRY